MRLAALAGAAGALAVFTIAGGLPAAAAFAASPAASPVASPPSSLGPVRSAWYDATYPQPTPTPPPAAPGVGPGDLVVSGATVSSSVLPLSPPSGPVTQTQPSAVTALLFAVPGGALPATLTLPLTNAVSTTTVDGKLPIGVTPEACPSVATFAAGGRQPWSAVPSYDCSGRTSMGQLSADGTAVVFSDIGSVARGKTLAIVIRPGTLGAERLVFAAPTAKALSLLSFDAAPAYDGTGRELPPAASQVLTGPRLGGSAPTSAVGGSLPSGPPGAPSTGVAEGQPPALATETPAALPEAASGSTAVRRAAALSDDARTRTILLAGLVLLLQATALLVLTDPRGSPWPLWAVLRAVRRGEPLPALPAKEWGVGRHRAPRRGPAPLL